MPFVVTSSATCTLNDRFSSLKGFDRFRSSPLTLMPLLSQTGRGVWFMSQGLFDLDENVLGVCHYVRDCEL